MGRGAQRDAPFGAPKTGFAGRLEVVGGPSGRRRGGPDDVKARIVSESFRRGARRMH